MPIPERLRPPAARRGLGPSESGPARSLDMTRNSVAFIVGEVVRMGCGFLAWLVAARLYPAPAVGVAAAAVSAFILCAQLAVMGTDISVVGLFPAHKRRPGLLFDTAFTLAVGAALVLGAIFLVIFLGLSSLREVATDPKFALAFLGLCVLASFWTLLDQTSLVLRRGDQVIVRGAIVGVVTLGLITAAPYALGTTGAATITLIWLAAFAASCLVGVWQLQRACDGYLPRPRVDRNVARGLIGLGVPNFVLTTADRAPILVVPIVASQLLSPAANAHWYTVQQIATALLIVPRAVGLVMYAETADEPATLRRQLVHGLRLAVVLSVVAALILAFVGPPLLGLLGGAYRSAGQGALQILLLSVFPGILMQAYYTACRVTNRLREAIAVSVVSAVATVGAASAAAVWLGIPGLAIGWVVALGAIAPFCLARLVRITRPAVAAGVARAA